MPTPNAAPASRWQQFRQYYLELPELGFALDASGCRFKQGWFEVTAPKLQKAFDAMAELEGGGIANPDENRRVGHYWLRNADLAPEPAIRGAITGALDQILTFAKQVHAGAVRPQAAPRFENVILAGIGGSALGPQLVASALGNVTDRMRIFFVDNTDPDGIDAVLAKVGATARGLGASLAVVTSKSGGTKETRNGMLEIAAAYQKANLNYRQHFVAITGEGSELDKIAESEHWLARFPMWDFVGGRTSVMSAVGLLPMALSGLDVEGFLAGARAMDAATRVRDARRNPAALLALAWHHATGGAGKRDMVILPYKDRLELFSRYLQQLVMESLGKEKDLAGRSVEQGIAVYGNKGSTDQHAYVQQLRDGVHNFFVTFIEVLRDRESASMEVEPGATSGDYLSAFLQGTRRALHDKGRETVTITMNEITAGSLGALIALYERAVGYYASIVNINAYHQPGVEAGKLAAASVLAVQRKIVAAMRNANKPMGVQEIASAAGAAGEEETVFKILQHLATNGNVKILRSRGATALDATYQAG